ncbi:MAG: hypothetical protein SAK29_18995 [Scytonema sp. PMC 1069.18]|nr:hypothetical protein [Scytonema sp. PMC 1069.18]MEC4883057.1 hypothetical protein [Scytonema sp. PMC 1070.18]
MLASASGDKTAVLWDLKGVLDSQQVLAYGCDWVRDYLQTNIEVEAEDRHLCNSLGTSKK